MSTPPERPFEDRDLPTLQNAVSGWVSTDADLGYCHPGDVPDRIYRGLRGRFAPSELVRIWEANGVVVGFVMVQPSSNGFDAFVAPTYLGATLEKTTIERGYQITRQTLNERGQPDRSVMIDAKREDHRRISALESSGFTTRQEHMHINELDLHDRLQGWRLPLGYTVRTATATDYCTPTYPGP